jgi:hypothetical protein
MAALGQAQGAQAQAEVAGTLEILRPGEGLPDAEVLLPDGDARGILARALAQHLGQGEFGEIQHISDPLRVVSTRSRKTGTAQASGHRARAAKPRMRRFACVHRRRPPSRVAQQCERRGKARSATGGCPFMKASAFYACSA